MTTYRLLARKGNWIKDATKNKGTLHRALGVPEDQKIPVAKIRDAAKNHKDPGIRKKANLALTLRKFHKK